MDCSGEALACHENVSSTTCKTLEALGHEARRESQGRHIEQRALELPGIQCVRHVVALQRNGNDVDAEPGLKPTSDGYGSSTARRHADLGNVVRPGWRKPARPGLVRDTRQCEEREGHEGASMHGEFLIVVRWWQVAAWVSHP